MSEFDALLPSEMAVRAEDVGVKKADLPWDTTLGLAVLGGSFIALGAVFSMTVAAGLPTSAVPFGLGRLAIGAAFSLGLVLVVVGGAELFTGNTLLVMAWLGGRISVKRLLRNWALVYLGNFIGAVGTAVLVFLSGQHRSGAGAVASVLLATAQTKAALPFGKAVVLGILCNVLVCLAVWLSTSARTTTDRVVAVVGPVAAFVAAGFEHSVANMFYLPLALLIRRFSPADFSSDPQPAAAFFQENPLTMLLGNLVPVTLGNIIGGGFMVGAVYWLIYLRRRNL